MKHVALLALVLACGGTPPPHTQSAAPKAGPPVAAVRPVKDTYHGVTVEDPYRWLEEDSAETKAWSSAQNAYARAWLDKLPDKATFAAELDHILNAPVTIYWDFRAAGGKLFALRKQPKEEQASLVVMPDPEHADAAQVVFAPISADHPRRSIDWFVPSPDGTKVAVAASDGGSEIADIQIVDLTGHVLETVPDAQRPTAGGDAGWTPDGKGLYYTRYPRAGEPHADEPSFWQQVYLHTLGAPVASDRYELGKDLPKDAEIMLDVDPSGRVIATVQKGDSGILRHYVKDGDWRQLDDWDDQVAALVSAGKDLYLVSRKDAPRGKILRMPATARNVAQAQVIVPEGKDAIVTYFPDREGITVAGDRLYVRYQLGGPSEVRAFTFSGAPATAPKGPAVSSAGRPVAWGTDILVSYASYTTPTTWSRFSAKTGALTELTDFALHFPVDFSNLEVRRELATSKDGTQVPLNILWPKGAPQDGSVPCVVYGYGGFEVSEEPHEWLTFAPLLTRGTCIVDVNLRGGSELGEAWHRAGMLLNKQNVFDDFAAAMQYVVDKRYTSRARLGIFGGSNGGLLMGAMITQHPELMKAVVSSVGIYDMLRNELTPNGQFNTSEYGSVTDPAQFKALYAYSPYHHVTRTAYPAILMHTGANDGRVAPWHSRKMVAALQAANTGSAPILLHTSETAGHGIGTNLSERIDLAATELAFLRAELQ